jgi:hypothetical protein
MAGKQHLDGKLVAGRDALNQDFIGGIGIFTCRGYAGAAATTEAGRIDI